METPIELTPGLVAAATPDDLKGRIEGLIGATVPPAQAKDLAQRIVETCGYDTPQALQDMDLADLIQAVPAVGHRKRVSRVVSISVPRDVCTLARPSLTSSACT